MKCTLASRGGARADRRRQDVEASTRRQRTTRTGIFECVSTFCVSLPSSIAETPLREGGLTITISAAYGVYAFSRTDDPQHAIEAADRAMYRTKAAMKRAD